MLALITKIVTNLVDFARGTRKNAEDIKKLNQQVNDLSNLVLTLTLKLEHSQQLSEAERRNLLLELEVVLQ